MFNVTSQKMELRKILKQLMVARDVRLTQVSRATQVPLTTLTNWIQGQKPRDVEQIKRVADFFGVSVDFLLFGYATQKNPEDGLPSQIDIGIYRVILIPEKDDKERLEIKGAEK